MMLNKQYTWKAFKEFRNQKYMPTLNNNATIGQKDAKLEVELNKISIEEKSKLKYSWSFEDALLHEYLNFESGLNVTIQSEYTDSEKLSFLNYWFENENILFWGIFNGDTKKMNSRSIGWITLDNLNEYIGENHPFKVYETHENFAEELWHSGGFSNRYMNHYFSFELKDFYPRGEEPKLHTYILNGGIYYTYLEYVKRAKNPPIFLHYIPEEIEKRHNDQLLKIAEMTHNFLKNYIVEFDPMRGIIPLK